MIRVLCLMLWLNSKALALTIAVGEVKTWPYQKDAVMKISRKGIIDLEAYHEGWRIFGLRKGVVTITPTLEDRELPKILIKVEESADSKSHLWGKWTDILCGSQDIICHKKSRTIKGVASSWSWFFQARHLCHKKQDCLFDVRLSKDAALDAQKHFLHFFSDPKITPEGYVVVSGHCSSKNKLVSLGPSFDAYIIKTCSKPFQTFMFSGKIYWLSGKEAQQFGLNPWGRLGENLLAIDTHKLYSFLETNSSRMLAKPRLRFRVGVKASVHQGFDLIYPREEGEVQVLKGGATIEVFPREIAQGKLLLGVTVNLRLPTGDQKSFESAHVASEIWLPFDQDVVLGQLEVQSEKLGEGLIPILANVPIVSPLFRREGNSSGHGQIYINLRVDKFDSDGKG